MLHQLSLQAAVGRTDELHKEPATRSHEDVASGYMM